MAQIKSVSRNQLMRMPIYRSYLIKKLKNGINEISAPVMAKELKLNEEKVRKDISLVSSQVGKPRQGRDVELLIQDIEKFIGYNERTNAVLVGVGHLGSALLGYQGFAEYGIDICMAFDANPNLDGTMIAGKRVYYTKNMSMLCRIMDIKIAVITVPAQYAQAVCDVLVEAGVKAIWNFAPIHLIVPSDVVVHNENMAASLAVLSRSVVEEKGDL